MWENIDADAISYVHKNADVNTKCRDFSVGNKKWDKENRVCELILMSKKCLDLQYLLKVDVVEKKVLDFRLIGGG